MKKLFIFIAISACTTSLLAQDIYNAVVNGKLAPEFAAVAGEDGGVANNSADGKSIVIMTAGKATVTAVGGTMPANDESIGGGAQQITIGAPIEGIENLYELASVGAWNDINWGKKNQGDIDFWYVTGTGNPYVKMYATQNSKDGTLVEGSYKVSTDYGYYEPDGSLGMPNYGLYYTFTATAQGAFKVKIWANKGNRKTFVVNAATMKAERLFASGFINGVNDENGKKKLLTVDEVDAEHHKYIWGAYNALVEKGKGETQSQEDYDAKLAEAKDYAEAMEIERQFVIGNGNQNFWGWLTFDVEPGEEYWVFQHSSQIGFGGFEFHEGITAKELIQGIVQVKTVELDKHEITMKKGDSVQFMAKVLPDNASDKTVNWESSNDRLATVDANGNVKALAEGEVFIKATSDFNDEASDSCRVNIVKRIEVTDSTIVWNDTTFVYTGLSPLPTWKNTQEEFTVTADMPELEKNVGSWETTVTFAFTDGVDTLVVDVPLRYTITPALLIIKANDAERFYGEENPEFTFTYEGFVNDETEEVLTQKPVATTTATSDSPVGTYPITVEGAKAENYTIEYVDGTLTVKENPKEVNENVTATEVKLKAGENTTLTVSLTTKDTDYNGYQFNLYLPEGISVVTDENGNYLVAEKTGREKVVLAVSDGSVLFYTTADKDHDALISGPLMEIELTADSALDAGNYTIRIERVVCATRENTSVSLPSSTVTVTVEKEAEEEVSAVVTADDVEGQPAGRIKLPVFLNNDTDINAFYFDLTLPKGITVAKDEDGNILASLVGDYADGKMLLMVQPWNSSMGTTNNVNTWRFVATPMDESVFHVNAGHVLNITLHVDADMASGVYTARMNVVKLVEADADSSRADSGLRFQTLRSPAATSWTSYSSITIKTAKPGDVNGDNFIDVADIATVIDVMAGGSGIANPLQQAADVNHDGTVDVADIAAIIDTMAANARRQR